MRIVLSSGTLARYPEGGGHWWARLQYAFALHALGQDWYWLAVLRSSGDPVLDQRRITVFFRRFSSYGFGDRCALVLIGDRTMQPSLEAAEVYGKSKREIRDIANTADLLWNFAGDLRPPFLELFRRRVFIDLDPGHVQVPAPKKMFIHDHDVFLTVGLNMRNPSCQVPLLGVNWQPFLPPVYLPLWKEMPDPGRKAPFSSITHWTWGTVIWRNHVLSTSKRTGYLRYIDLPKQAGRTFELAANIAPDDKTGDRELLVSGGWHLVDPHRVARSPPLYRRYIANSRAEIMCPKPIFRELETGWFSDRSACYLASGRPVLAEDTGFTDYLPTGKGLLAFRDLSEAIAGVIEIDSNYTEHMRAARELAEEYFDARRCLEVMLSCS